MNIKSRLLKLETRNEGHDEGVAELLAILCESTGYPMPDKLPSGAEMDAILKGAIGTALRPCSEGRK